MNGSGLTEMLLFGAFFIWRIFTAEYLRALALFLVAKSNEFID